MIVAVVLAGGTGTRVGGTVPKQFIEVQGKPVLAIRWSGSRTTGISTPLRLSATGTGWRRPGRIVKTYGFTKTRWITEGGETFQESTMKGIFHLKGALAPEDIVVISFGVSPFTTDDIIDDGIRVCRLHGNAVAAEDAVLCTCIKDDDYSSTTSILRETIKGFSNPWTFRFGELCESYEEAERRGILADLEPHTTSLYFALGKRIWFSKTSGHNFKITTKEDLERFEGLLLLREKRQAQLGGI